MTDLAIDWAMVGDAPLAVAVSGGADSFALLHALAERGLPLVALTVDHGLRAGSAEDARAVAAWCEARGIPHETLVWQGEKPVTGIQDAARGARYRLLCEACERLSLDRLAAGHTLDDQAETVFMRLRRGAGRGLAGMPPSRKIASGPGEPVTLLRPMLGVRRAKTRSYADQAGLPVRWDPSNEDETFERVRVRRLLTELEEKGMLTAAALGRTARAHQASQHASDREWAWGNIGDRVADEPDWFGEAADGSYYTYRWGNLDRRRDQDRLMRSLQAVSSQAVPTERDELHLFVDRLPVTLGGVIADHGYRNGGCFFLYREPAALLGRADGTPGLAPIPAPPGTKHLYDRRFIVHIPADVPPGTELCPLGQLVPRDIATSTLSRSRVATLPCLSLGPRVTHLPAAAIGAVREAFGGWKRAAEVLPSTLGTFEARSLLAERFANDVIRY